MNKATRWFLLLVTMAAFALTILACGSSDSPVFFSPDRVVGDCAPGGLIANIIVSSVDGNDATGNGTCLSPYKTITAGLDATSTFGNIVWVNSGTYDSVNGEVFPLVVPAGVSLVGDKANNGNGGSPTLISGKGQLGASIYNAGLFPGQGATVSGFSFNTDGYEASRFDIIINGVDATVSNSTFLSGPYGGIRTYGLGNSVIEKNVISAASYGVYLNGTGNPVVQDNHFVVSTFGISCNDGEPLIQRNTFNGSGFMAMQLQGSCSPRIEDNDVNSTNFLYGGIRSYGLSPVLRGNTFTLSTGPALHVYSSSAPDLGTDPSTDPGNNTFIVADGVDMIHNGTAIITSMGNTWSATPPVCGTNIITDNTGTVYWGTGVGESCPLPVGCEVFNITPDIAVDAVDGNDGTADGTCALPYKTITNALAASTFGNVVWVNSGTYNAANGEVFPLVVPAGVSLVGDKANNGAGSSPTLISGKGLFGASIFNGALYAGQGSDISGFSFDTDGWVPNTYGVIINGVDATISSSTFLSSAYGGINSNGVVNSVIENNVFSSNSYGVLTSFTGTLIIQDNSFIGGSYAIRTQGSATILRNTFTTSGHQAIQVLGGSPSIEDNVFTTAGGYTYAAIRTSGTATPVLRGNTFTIGTGPAIQAIDPSSPDLGTDPTTDPGNNTFTITTGPDIDQTSSTAIDAMGNTWTDNPPVCGTNIIGTGTVYWGTGGGENCP